MRNLIGSVDKKYLFYFTIGKLRWPPSWKSFMPFLALTERPTDRKIVRNIRATCRTKLAEIVPIGNPRWQKLGPSWKSFLRFYSWNERSIDLKLGRSITVTCRSKIVKFCSIGYPRWPSWTSTLNFVSWTERLIDLNLVTSIRVTCRSKIVKHGFDWKSKMAAILKIYFGLNIFYSNLSINMHMTFTYNDTWMGLEWKQHVYWTPFPL